MNEGGSSHFCLLPKSALTHTGWLLFIRYSGVVNPGPVNGASKWSSPGHRGTSGSASSLWKFLCQYPQVFVVLLTDKNYLASDILTNRLRPSLGGRVIGATNPSDDDPTDSMEAWLSAFGKNPGVAIDNRLSQHTGRADKLVPITNETGIGSMDLQKASDLLKLGDTIFDRSMPIEDRLKLAANLYLGGQRELANLILSDVSRISGISISPPFRGEDGAISALQFEQSEAKKFSKLSTSLGIRFRVETESIYLPNLLA